MRDISDSEIQEDNYENEYNGGSTSEEEDYEVSPQTNNKVLAVDTDENLEDAEPDVSAASRRNSRRRATRRNNR